MSQFDAELRLLSLLSAFIQLPKTRYTGYNELLRVWIPWGVKIIIFFFRPVYMVIQSEPDQHSALNGKKRIKCLGKVEPRSKMWTILYLKEPWDALCTASPSAPVKPTAINHMFTLGRLTGEYSLSVYMPDMETTNKLCNQQRWDFLPLAAI